jgi:DNA-binding IscR family transcriptional regulator
MGGLRDAGLVRSEKGHAGGWTLLRPLDEVTMLDVYKAVGEPRIFAIGLADSAPQCLVEQAVNASMTEALEQAERLLISQLADVTLAQIASDFDQRMALLGREGEG